MLMVIINRKGSHTGRLKDAFKKKYKKVGIKIM
jgi:hypothetical protein